jgi:hypothetical protein
MNRLLIAGALALGGLCVSSATAHADPSVGLLVELHCQGETFQVVVAGNGEWTPAHDLNSNLVGVPIAFGEFTGTFTPTEGEPETFTEPGSVKPNMPRSSNLVVECTFSFSETSPEGTFTGSGSVTLLVPRIKP